MHLYILEYRIKGKKLPPATKENNLVILDENDDDTGEVSEIIRSVKQLLARKAKARLNEIPDNVVLPPPEGNLFCLFLLLYVPCQQLWSLRDGQFT